MNISVFNPYLANTFYTPKHQKTKGTLNKNEL